MKKLTELLLLLILFICFFIINHSFYIDNNKDKLINVYLIKDHVKKTYELKIGDTLNDLINCYDIDIVNNFSFDYDIDYPLFNNQIIVYKDNNSLISINYASQDQLITLPGIGIATAKKIIDYRNLHNGFKYLEELKNVSGIGEKKYERIKDYITL